MRITTLSFIAFSKTAFILFKTILLVFLAVTVHAADTPTDDSPAQTDFIHVTDRGWLVGDALNGKQFGNGFSFSGWFYFKQLPTEHNLLMGYSWESLVLETTGDGTLDLWLLQDSLRIDEVALNQWVNLAVTLEGSSVKFFVDGDLAKESSVATDVIEFPSGENDFFSLGGFWGHAKQIKFWDRTLTEAELGEQVFTFDSRSSDPAHQWLLDEGVAGVLNDSGRNPTANMFIYEGTAFWSSIHSPYEVIADSYIESFEIQPLVHVWGTADFDQDGRKEVFVHGADDYVYPDSEPMLIFKVGEDNSLTNVSDSMIDGGLYEKNFPSGRETVVADLNSDGFDDIFYVNSAGHAAVIQPELPSLLLSDGAKGKLFPSEQTIKAPPCTLTQPAFSGQKPCQSSDANGQVYPDPDAPLVEMDPRATGHGGAFGDIDRDGDLDLYSMVTLGAERDQKPVTPHFLINDGQGNFTANWQLVPFKAFNYWTELQQLPDGSTGTRDLEYPIAHLEDFDGDGFLDMALIGQITDAARQFVPETPFSVETERAWESRYELIAWGDASGFSEQYTILQSGDMPVPDAAGPNAQALSMDIDGDGDQDLIVGRDRADHIGVGHYIQVYRNEGDRIFVDRTSELIPQSVEQIAERPAGRGFQEFDFNRDGCPDFALTVPPQGIAAGNMVDSHRLWLNDCSGRFTAIRDSYIGKMGLLFPIDIDQDGGQDFVSLDRGFFFGPFISGTVNKQVGQVDIEYFIDTDGDGTVDALDLNALNGIAGLWYDPSLDGEGFNVITTPAGMVIFFYGYTSDGERLWLMSELLSSDFKFEQVIDLGMYEGQGGTFSQPAPSAESLAEWGRLKARFDACGNGRFDLDGKDGIKKTRQLKLAGVTNADCETNQLAAPSGLAGLWYDSALDGEGFNVIITNTSTIFFFYGYDMNGDRLWLISETLAGAPQVGDAARMTMYSASGGTFDVPRPSAESLSSWGELEVTFSSCTEGTATLVGADGEKTSAMVKLAGISGSTCP